jgi:hypothetical protein
VAIAKVLVSPANGLAAQINEQMVFQITVTNVGDTVLDTVPVEDTYQTHYMSYVGSVPPTVNNDNDGTLNWANVGPLAPKGSTNLYAMFTARAGTVPQWATNVVVTRPTTTNGVPVPSATNRAIYKIDDSIDVDNVSTGAFQGVSSGSVMHPVLPGSTNRLLLVGISVNNTPEANGLITNVTYGALPMTLAGARTNDDKVVSMWVLKNPPVGTTNVVVRFNRPPGEGFVVGVMTFRNVDQAKPYRDDAFASSIGESGDPTLTVSAEQGEMVVDTVALQGTNLTAVGVGQAQRWSRNSVSARGYATGGGSTKAGDTSVVMSWTVAPQRSSNWALGALAIRPHRTPILKASQTALQSSLNPSGLGVPVTFTATVTGDGSTPTGAVQFKIDGTDVNGPVGLVGGNADLIVSDLPEGMHTVTVLYLGDATFDVSSSLPLEQTVGSAPTLVISAIRIVNGETVVEWPGIAYPPWRYTVETTPSLYPLVPWTNLLGHVDMPGVAGTMSATDTNVISGAKFYRVKMQ